jgi:hypothetical protein
MIIKSVSVRFIWFFVNPSVSVETMGGRKFVRISFQYVFRKLFKFKFKFKLNSSISAFSEFK